MKIHSLSKILILPVVLMGFGIYYYAESFGNRSDTIWLFVPVFLLVVLYIFSPQIDYFWHKRYPVPLDPKIKSWIGHYFEFYKKLSDEDKSQFEYRLGLYIEAREFKAVGSELRDVPEDLKGIIACYPIMLSFRDPNFLLGDYDRIYLYHHPFPSPGYPFLHTVEVNHEDGVVIFSLEQFLPGVTNPENHFPVGLYAFLEVYFELHQIQLPNKVDWDGLHQFQRYSEKQIVKTTGRTDLDPDLILAVQFFISPSEVGQFYPENHHFLKNLFFSESR